MPTTDNIQPAPPPWKLKATTIYSLAFWTTKEQVDQATAAGLTYSALEAQSSFADSRDGKHLGGVSVIQIIRYSETPVGPYDELVLIPGFHEYTVEEAGGRRATKKNARITRIYVSQEHTCWNGRKNWNVPKHLASFDFRDNVDGSTTIKVFANDTAGDATEASADSKPLFQGTFTSFPYIPAIPSSTSMLKYVGLDATLVQPPLPDGKGSRGELPGTDRWCAVFPAMYSPRTSLGWIDVRQPGEVSSCTQDNFWPGLKPWQLAVKMDDAEIDFGIGMHWDPPRSVS
ncbi:hypothetical protein GMORB2_5465 [Geosmithia morbida]|uniref:Uncharacterized protein n=1 Tax=Geosmithia morbida TaxID=1094350 RepID=A0A9P4Z1A5_9HYPO|nr:uncharacterized protein GMORB2_5465 [Geosmithia morbida]KAF4124799.1 hypothetical protein GMORB2_5465 [Geosmithia morbida]